MNQSTNEKPVTNNSRDDKQALTTRITSGLLPLLAALGIPAAKKAQAKGDQLKQEARAKGDQLKQEARAKGDQLKQDAQAKYDQRAQEAKDGIKTPAKDTA